jgi:uncharacterized RDD family membrane protein YckC
MNEVDKYLAAVLGNIHASAGERQRIETDLRAHIEAAESAGETVDSVIARMGSPVEVAVEFMAQCELPYAGFWRRLAAFAIDLGLIMLTGGGSSLLFIWASNHVPRHPLGWEYVLGAILIALCAGCILATFGIIVLYFPILEGRFGQTLGKKLFGLRVLRENGLPINYKEAFLRRISYYFEVLPVDALFIPFTAKRQRAFDIVARTIVVRQFD